MEITPNNGETLISFLSRAAKPRRLGWSSFLREVIGVTFRNARLAERRSFDFGRISTSLGVGSAALEGMSERTKFPADRSDEQIAYIARREFPWLDAVGYSTYNPIRLSKGQYLTTEWLQPDAIIDDESGTLNLHHCPNCCVNLATHAASNALPLCPKCGARLDRGPKFPASQEIATFSRKIKAEYGPALGARPLLSRSPDLVRFALGWRIAKVFQTQPARHSLAAHFVGEAGLGDLVTVEIRRRRIDVSTAAVRHIQLLAAGLYVAVHFEGIAALHSSFYQRNGNLDGANEAIANALCDLEGTQFASLNLG